MSLSALVCITAACGNKGKSVEQPEVEGTAPAVTVIRVFAEDVPQTSTYTSVVEPFVKNNIAPQSVMRIKDINVEIGDFVKAGQVVAEMDAISLQQARLQMINDSTEYSRLKVLYEAGGLSRSDLEAMELKYNVTKTSYDNMLENTILMSPVDGVITARHYDKGDMFTMGQPIYTVEQITPVKLLVGISEVDYTKVKKGDQVEITVEAFPGQTFKGSINRLYPTIDPATHTFTVEVIVPNKDRTLRPGMFARVTVRFGVNHSVVVPDAAVVKQTGSGERFIYVLNPDNTVTYTNVKLGRRMDTRYEILSGIEEGAEIVTEGQIRLKSGIEVTVNR